MKRNVFVVLLLLMTGVLYGYFSSTKAASVALNEKNFPEEYFRYYISTLYDENEDGKLSDAERNKVTEIDVGEYSEYRALYEYPVVQTLKGIEYFPNLRILSCDGNALRKLDVSKNRKLQELYCYSNAIKILNLKQNKKLEKLYCYYNEIASLDVSMNKELEYLYCSDNKIKVIDLNKNRKLKEISVGANKLKKINVKKLDKLEKFFCYGNLLKELDVSENLKLVYLACNGNKLKKLYLKKNKELDTLYCYGNCLTKLDLSGNKLLQYLYCKNNQLITGNVKISRTQLGNTTFSPQKKTIRAKKIGKYYYVPLKGVNRTNEIVNLSAGTMTERGIRLKGKKLPKKITYEYNMFTDGEERTKVEIKVKRGKRGDRG